MTRIALINPNTSTETTALMVRIAADQCADDSIEIVGLTVAEGPIMITTEPELAASAERVAAEFGSMDRLTAAAGGPVDAVIVSAFGDPGLDALRRHLPIPCVGIGESAIGWEVPTGSRVAVATTTPDLAGSITRLGESVRGRESFVGVFLTATSPLTLRLDPDSQRKELRVAVDEARRAGADIVVIGGGPLGESADALAREADCPVRSPIREACRAVLSLLAEATAAPRARHTDSVARMP